VSTDERAEQDATDTTEETAPAGDDPNEDPNQSTKGLLDERKLRADARKVDAEIQDARNRNA
jgi:hypothetical protein